MKLFFAVIAYSLVLESFAGNQSSERLIFFALSVSLPPVWILLRDNMQYIAFLKTDSKLSTWYVGIFFWVVVKMCSYVLYLY